MSIEKETTPTGNPLKIVFVFTCRDNPAGHDAQKRSRMNTSHGTTNLKRSRNECLRHRNLSQEGSAAGAQQMIANTVSNYTPARHRALIAARCAVSQRPFNIVKDPYYVEEVKLLRPGTTLPSPKTISLDVRKVYERGANHVKTYFQVCPLSFISYHHDITVTMTLLVAW